MPERREIDPSKAKGIYPLLGTLVTPRPIAWVSSMSAEGVDNLAPHSFFQIVSTAPPIVMISSMGEKDTVRNVRATGEFVVCGSPASMIEQINLSEEDKQKLFVGNVRRIFGLPHMNGSAHMRAQSNAGSAAAE